jgi:hypothetical protein
MKLSFPQPAKSCPETRDTAEKGYVQMPSLLTLPLYSPHTNSGQSPSPLLSLGH